MPQNHVSAKRRQRFAFIAVIALAAPLGAASAAQLPDETQDFIVGFHALPTTVRPGTPFHGGLVMSTNSAIDFAVVRAVAPEAFVERAHVDPDVRYVEEDRVIDWLSLVTPDAAEALPGPGTARDRDAAADVPWKPVDHGALDGDAGAAFTPNDPRFTDLYGLTQIRADEAWDTTFGDTSSAVCVLDTGVRYTHEDLAGSRWLGGYDYVNNDDDPWDDQGHGTHVSGTAAASIDNGVGISGVARASIYGVKVLNSAGSGSYSNIANGVTWCADNTMTRTVLSLSLGGSSGSAALADAVSYAYDTKGKLIVSAAGNDGPCGSCVGYPAKYAKSMAVGCTTITLAVCGFSSRGPEVEIAAPGDDITSTYYSNDASYRTLDGTSMSTPHVSGAAALLWSHFPTLTNVELRDRLTTYVQDLGDAGRDEDFGFGKLDLVCVIASESPCGPPPPPPPEPPAVCSLPGPDAFGYQCVVTAHTFEDVSAIGAPLPLTDDDVEPVPLPFAFTFHGAARSTAYVSSNGFIAFSAGQGNGCCRGQELPSSAQPNDLVAGYWEDLNPSRGGTVKHATLGDAPERRFIVQWTDVPHYPNTKATTFQIVLFEGSNDIVVRFDDVASDGGNHVTGIEDATGTRAVYYQYGDYEWDDETVKFTTALGPDTVLDVIGDAGAGDWFVATATATASCVTTAAACASTEYRVDDGAWTPYAGPVTFTADGSRTLTARSTDTDGRIGAAAATTVNIDSVAPTVTATPSCGLAGDNGWCRGPAGVTVSATDGTSGVASSACTLNGGVVACGTLASLADGDHTVVVSATDAAGHTASATATIAVDGTPPTASPSLACALTGDDGWCRSASADYTTAAVDATSGVATSSCRLDGAAAPCSGTVAALGWHTLDTIARDAAGNTVSDAFGFGIDATAPSVAVAATCALPGTPGWCRSASFDFAGTATDATSGLASGQPTCEVDGALSACDTVVTGEGGHVFAVAARDAAGHVASAAGVLAIDSEAPSAAVTVTCGAPSGPYWCRAPTVGYSATVADTTSGVDAASVACTVDDDAAACDGNVVTPGHHEVEITALDVAGNVFTLAEGFGIDVAPPDLTVAAACAAPGEAGWCRDAVTLTATAADALSGVADVTCALNAVAFTCPTTRTFGDGTHEASAVARDAAGNEAFAALETHVDATPPVSRLDVTGVAGRDGWWLADVAVDVACTDATSGCAAVVTSDPSVLAADGVHHFTYHARDVAGNPEDARTTDISVDGTRPDVAVSLAGPAGENGWFVGDVTVTATCTDATSGVRPFTLHVRVGAAGWQPYDGPFVVRDDGSTPVHVACDDVAGNRGVTVEHVRIDTAAPFGEATAPAVAAGAFDVAWEAGDATSGVAAVVVVEWSLLGTRTEVCASTAAVGSCSVPAGAGVRCFAVEVRDVAGHSSAAQPFAEALRTCTVAAA